MCRVYAKKNHAALCSFVFMIILHNTISKYDWYVEQFFLVLINQERQKVHCHDTSSNALALVKTTGSWCHAFAFPDCDPTPTLFKIAS